MLLRGYDAIGEPSEPKATMAARAELITAVVFLMMPILLLSKGFSFVSVTGRLATPTLVSGHPLCQARVFCANARVFN